MTAVSFSVKCGSFDSLNVFRRCGLRPCASQIRCTVAALTPCALAIERQLQCVCPGGFVCVVACTICLIFAAEIAGLRPRPGFVSVNAAVPPSSNRRRHRITVGRLTPSLRAISLFDSPAAAASTIRARQATLCGLFCAATQRPSSARCSTERAVAAIAAATRSTLLHHYPYVKLFQRQCTRCERLQRIDWLRPRGRGRPSRHPPSICPTYPVCDGTFTSSWAMTRNGPARPFVSSIDGSTRGL